MGSDESEEEESTELNIDASMISEITITRTGVAPITAYADTASPADSEPSTLEPQLGVRGLAPHGASSSSAPPPPIFAEVGGRQDSEADYESEDERTTQNLESHVQVAYDRAMTSAARAVPKTQLSPIVLTPSEPIRLDEARSALGALAQRRPAPIPAAGRPPEQELDRESAVTAKRGPEKVESLGVVATIRPIADTEDFEEDTENYEEETKTDAVQSALVAASRARAETRPIPEMQRHPALEPDETRTKRAPLTLMSAQAALMMEDLPQHEPIAVESAPLDLDAQAGAGGTVRMFFNPTTGKATAHPDSERRVVGPYLMQPFGEQPTVQALPLQQNPAMAAPAIVRNPAAPDETHGPRRRRRRVMPLVLLFVVVCAASGAAVLFRGQLVPWITALLPMGGASVAPPASSVPDPSASASVVSADAVPSALATASAGPVPTAPTTGTAPASAATPTSSAALSAAAASASAQRNSKNKHPPPKK